MTDRQTNMVTIEVNHATKDWGQVTLYNDDPKYWCTIVEMFGESIHQGFDGWEPHEQEVIQRYLEDIISACNTALGVVNPVNIPGPHPNRRR